MSGPNRQRGVALITALLIMALLGILAANLTWDNGLDVRRTMTMLYHDEGAQAAADGRLVEAGCRVEAVAVCQGQAVMAQLGGPLHQVLGIGGALQKGEGAAAAQLHVVRRARHGEGLFSSCFRLSSRTR